MSSDVVPKVWTRDESRVDALTGRFYSDPARTPDYTEPEWLAAIEPVWAFKIPALA